VIVYRFGHEDLLRTRFAISPLMELVGSFEVARDPSRAGPHAPWAARVAARVRELDLPLLDVAVPREARVYPDFVSPPPEVPAANLTGELDRIRSVAPEQVARELALAYPGGVPEHGRPLLDDPRRALRALAAEMRRYWDVALAGDWDAVLALLESEIAWRARRLAAVGPGAAFADLSPHVRWDAGAVHVTARSSKEVELDGRGLLLVPAAFAGPTPWPMNDKPWQPSIVYTPRGAGDLWAPVAADDGALADLLGTRRAAILRALRRPASTADLARRLGASPAGVSEHLGVLRRAGLVAGRREGRFVVYARTRAGDALAAPAPREHEPAP
jgi:DNA-binding transcriptional ArsR family regulator